MRAKNHYLFMDYCLITLEIRHKKYESSSKPRPEKIGVWTENDIITTLYFNILQRCNEYKEDVYIRERIIRKPVNSISSGYDNL